MQAFSTLLPIDLLTCCITQNLQTLPMSNDAQVPHTILSSSSIIHSQPLFTAAYPRPYLRCDSDLKLLPSLQDLEVPILSNVVWQPRSNEDDHLYGGFGYVWRGLWNKQQVAAKFLKSPGTGSGNLRRQKLWWRELTAWNKLVHPNILPLIGVVRTDSMYPGMVSPYMANGSALRYLTTHPEADVVQILLDVANGMRYLAERTPPIAHGDLKGNNVLIDDDGRARICDFGMSRFIRDLMSSDSTSGGTVRRMAPERFEDHSKVSLQADIFAWGMLALELMTGDIPWREVRRDPTVVLKVAAGHRPSRPMCKCIETCMCLVKNDRLWELVEWCWKAAPRERPDAQQLYRELDEAKVRMM